MRRAVLAALALAVLAAGGCTAPDPPPVNRLVIATGGQGGVYYTLGHAYAAAAGERWGVAVDVLTTAAAVENLQLIAAGKADVAFATADAAALAAFGQKPFAGPVPLVALAGLYDDYLQIVVRADSAVRAVADLRGARVSTGSANSGTEIVARRVLEAAGLDEAADIKRHRMSAAASADALHANRIDAFFFTGGLPTPAVAELARKTPIRILPVAEEMATLQDRYGDFYLTRSIPASTYPGLDGEIATLGIANVLVARRDLPERAAFELTALLFEAKPRLAAAHAEGRRLDRRAALATYPVPLHPGAARYYRETKSLA
jgi:uncharacterized protein